MSYFEIRSEKLSTPASVALLQEAVDLKYTPQEYRACQIGLLFDKIRSEFFPGPYTCLSRTSDKRKSKAFPYFFTLADMEDQNKGILPDISIYLRAQLEITKQKAGHPDNHVPLSPHCLVGPRAMDRYIAYVSQIRAKETYGGSMAPIDKEKTVIQALGKTALFLAKLGKDLLGTSDFLYSDLMEYRAEGDFLPKFIFFVTHGFVSRYFLTASKSYISFVGSLDPDFQEELPQDLGTYEAILKQYPRALQFGRQAFPLEFKF